VPRKPDPTEEEMNADTAKIMKDMESYFVKYYGPRCPEYEKGCVVCEVWELYDELHLLIK